MHEEHSVRGLEETLAVFRLGNQQHFGDDLDSPWIFRGLRNPEWQLVPKVWRPNFLTDYPSTPKINALVKEVMASPTATSSEAELRVYGDNGRLSEALTRLFVEYQLLRNFSMLADDSGIGSFNARLRDDLETNVRRSVQADRWISHSPSSSFDARAQHYGVPTRLLDWSRDPLTALYFALLGEGSEQSVIWALNIKSPTSLEPPGAVRDTAPQLTMVEPPSLLDKRIVSQSGTFTFVHRGESMFVLSGKYPEVGDMVEEDRLIRRYTIELSSDERLAAKKVLFRERRTMAHLMPDLRSSWDVAEDYYRSGLLF